MCLRAHHTLVSILCNTKTVDILSEFVWVSLLVKPVIDAPSCIFVFVSKQDA